MNQDSIMIERQWTDRAKQAYELGLEYEKTYHGCGQCTVAAVLDALDQFDESVFRAATGIAGGMGLMGDGPCGAYVGASMAFGLLSPRRREFFDGDRENKYGTYAMIQRLRERFLQHYGSFTCRGVQEHVIGRGFDLRDPQDRQAFEQAGAHEDKCPLVVAQAARWAVEIVAEQQITMPAVGTSDEERVE
ncbi:MAG: C-GCAxxG-C-C family protein [Chloroflexota bacterium]|nr:C-GCAxxG-C-C family protein [Chloroflexota bacterium]